MDQEINFVDLEKSYFVEKEKIVVEIETLDLGFETFDFGEKIVFVEVV